MVEVRFTCQAFLATAVTNYVAALCPYLTKERCSTGQEIRISAACRCIAFQPHYSTTMTGPDQDFKITLLRKQNWHLRLAEKRCNVIIQFSKSFFDLLTRFPL